MDQPKPGRVHDYARMSFVEQRHDVSLEDQERQLRELAQAYYADRELILWL